MYLIAAQAVGIIGLLFAIISFQQNTSKRILLFQSLASFSFSIHFFMLGAYTGMLMNIIGVGRNLFFYKRKGRWANSRLWLYIFIIGYIAAGAVTYKDIYSIMPTTGMVLSTIALWLKNPKHIRHVMLPSSPLWFAYNLVNMSVAGMLTEIFASTSLIIAMVRFDYNKCFQHFLVRDRILFKKGKSK